MKSILVLIQIIIIIISHLGPTIARPNNNNNNNFTNVILQSDEGRTTDADDRVFVTVTQKNGFTTFENRGLMSENKLADDDKIIKDPYRKSVNDITTNEKLSVIDKDHTAENNHQNVNHNKTSVLQSIPIIEFHFEAVKTPFVIGIWILSASIAKIGFHKTPSLHKIFPESCLLIVIGVIIGFVLMFALPIEVSPLTPTTFFFYMLPPIILDAGYFMPNRLFFDNLGTILLMAVVGTIFNIATIGLSLWACGLLGIYGENPPILHTFVFASLISAVDPVAVLAVFEEIHVNEILYIVVFGESLLNDAVTVVLYHMCESYTQISVENIDLTHLVSGPTKFFVVALGGTFIGVIWGFLTGFITRFTDNVRVIEPIFIFVMAYLAYLNAELFGMSGIMAITFCGISMKNYVESNISQKSHTTIKYALKMLSSSSETVIFMFLGVATVNSSHDWNSWFVVATIVFCTIYRGIGVIILTALANKFRLHKLSNVDQFVMSYGGLRGAVAFALVLLIDKNKIGAQPMFVTTTIAVIYFTVFLQGITIKPLVKFLNVERANKKKPTMNERIHERFIDHLMAGIEDIVGKTGNYNVRDKFKRFDNKFIRPALIRDLKKGAEPKILETYSKLAMKDAMDYMRRNPSTIGQMSGTESMSALFRNYTTTLGGRLATTLTEPIQCPSFSNLENCSRNLDMQELDYNPSKKDLTDARIHHLLAEELKPYKRHRRLSYSRHAVDDRDLTTQQVNYKMHMNIRRMNDRKHHKRSKRGSSKESGLKQNHVSFPEMKQNGSTKQLSHGTNKHYSYRNIVRNHTHSLIKYRRLDLDYINEVLNETPDEDNKQTVPNDDWDDGLTFTAKTSRNDKSDINEIIDSPHSSSNDSNDKEKRLSKDSESETRVTTPTAIETQLPWKRDDGDDGDCGAIKQNEFPAWASNKEYLAYNSPSATFLGGLTKPRQVMSVIGLFRRESTGSGSGLCMSEAGSDPMLAQHLTSEIGGGGGTVSGIKRTPLSSATVAIVAAGNRPHDRRSASVCGVSPIFESNERNTDMKLDNPNFIGFELQGHSSPFAVTASHRRNARRSSLLELNGQNKGHYFNLKSRPSDTIPEEIYSSSFPERNRVQTSPKPYKEPLLPLSDESDKAQIIQQQTSTNNNNNNNNPQMKSLLISNNDDDNSEANEEDIEEDGDDDKKQHKHYRQRPDDTDI